MTNPDQNAVLKAEMRAEEAHRRISEHEDRCFQQGRETRAAVDDLHRRVDEVHGRVTELGEDLRDGFRNVEAKITEQALAGKDGWLRLAGRCAVILGTAVVGVLTGLLMKQV